MDQTKLDELKAQYRKLCHGMQTGVAMAMFLNASDETKPKQMCIRDRVHTVQGAALIGGRAKTIKDT